MLSQKPPKTNGAQPLGDGEEELDVVPCAFMSEERGDGECAGSQALSLLQIRKSA
jgi:hypothetical protein